MKTAAARSSLALLCLFIATLVVTGLPGCGGCTSNPTADVEAERKRKEEEEKKKKEKPKPDFVAGRLMTQPNNIDTIESATKPGHWTSATVEMTANNFDFLGEMVTDPFDLGGMPFRLGTSRPAVLPKGQKKYLELTFYVPPGKTGAKTSVRLLTQGGHREVLQELYTIRRQPAHQFYFVVLSRSPDRYSFLKVQHSISPPSDDMGFSEGADSYYKVLTPKIDKRVPLPSNPLTWTSIAYLLWDDVEPGLLTPEQQQALLDWLHWGGQLVVSGPDTLDTLRGSFLEPYLPATGGDPLALTTETFAPVSQKWSLPDQPLKLVRPWTGRQLVIDPEVAETRVVIEGANSEPLVVERRAGRGAVLVTAFRLSQRELRQWKSFDNFLNGAILRRQPRAFSQSGDDGFHLLRVQWDQPPAHTYDPTRISALNYLTRDAQIQDASPLWNWVLEGPPPDVEAGGPPPLTAATIMMPDEEGLFDGSVDESALIGPGVAGWEDFNAAAETARRSLREAAGITIPQASFVVMVLAAYLTVLVPVNWTVFRLLGRVEWAWIAAPILSIGFALAVVRLAQLDIGFARSKTELAVVEFNGAYPRAHVTRYTALYTSLATRYDLRFEDASALVQPFPPHSRDEAQTLLRGQSRDTVNFRRVQQAAAEEDQAAASIALEGFEVSSNSLGMVHSEHMYDLGGGLELKGAGGGRQVANNTYLKLEGAAAIRAVPTGADKSAGGFEMAWIGELPPGAAKSLTFEPVKAVDLIAKFDEAWRPSSLDLSELRRLALTQLPPGETRLIAWTPEEIPGTAVEPSARQARHAAMIVAHLTHGPRPDARPDTVPFVHVKQIEDDLPEPDPAALDDFQPVP